MEVYEDDMAKRVDADKYPFLKLLLYGSAGSTKTRTAYTAQWDERTCPALVLEQGGNPISTRSYKQRPDIVHMEELVEYNAVYEWIKAGQPINSPIVQKLELRPPYKTIIIDGITEIQRYSFQQVLGTKAIGPATIPPSAQRQHFGQVLAQMTTFARLFFDEILPLHVIVTALEREDNSEATGEIFYKPLLWGQSAGEVPGYAYMVLRLMHRARISGKIQQAVSQGLTPETEAIALFKPGTNFVAKDQYGTGLTYMVDPSIPKIMDAIYGPA